MQNSARLPSDVVPLVGSRAAVEFPRLAAELEGHSEPPAAWRLNEFLSFMFVVPTNAGVEPARTLSFESDPLETAIAAAAASVRPDFQRIGNGTFQSATKDGFDSSRIFLTDAISNLAVRGEPVALVAHNDLLVVTGSDDVDGLRQLGAIGWSTFDHPKPTSARPVVLQNGRWEPLRLPSDHPLHSQFATMEYRELHVLYGKQRKLLRERFGRTGSRISVAPYEVTTNSAGAMISYCTWTGLVDGDGISSDLLLPAMADEMQLVLVNDGAAEQLVGRTDRGCFERECAEILEDTEYWPPLRRVRKFPTPEMVTGLGGMWTSNDPPPEEWLRRLHRDFFQFDVPAHEREGGLEQLLQDAFPIHLGSHQNARYELTYREYTVVEKSAFPVIHLDLMLVSYEGDRIDDVIQQQVAWLDLAREGQLPGAVSLDVDSENLVATMQERVDLLAAMACRRFAELAPKVTPLEPHDLVYRAY
ncbi:hypothetical protein LZC95_19030 [Pendulispora brunnea]|uniref:Uncharacterized protein n=1 Tax=Pendulispora brunnea TaxID=2905690 RepID=A0ABZ2KNH7_9BACT